MNDIDALERLRRSGAAPQDLPGEGREARWVHRCTDARNAVAVEATAHWVRERYDAQRPVLAGGDVSVHGSPRSVWAFAVAAAWVEHRAAAAPSPFDGLGELVARGHVDDALEALDLPAAVAFLEAAIVPAPPAVPAPEAEALPESVRDDMSAAGAGVPAASGAEPAPAWQPPPLPAADVAGSWDVVLVDAADRSSRVASLVAATLGLAPAAARQLVAALPARLAERVTANDARKLVFAIGAASGARLEVAAS